MEDNIGWVSGVCAVQVHDQQLLASADKCDGPDLGRGHRRGRARPEGRTAWVHGVAVQCDGSVGFRDDDEND